jgi:hypothetical protein
MIDAMQQKLILWLNVRMSIVFAMHGFGERRQLACRC